MSGESKEFSDLLIRETPKTLRELALDKVRSAILELRFQPGERLTERDLCAQLGVSRSVVREVIRHLETEGLIQNVPFHGPIVARLDPEQVEQIYEIRSQLESTAAAACARRASTAQKVELRKMLQQIGDAYAAENYREVLAATTRFYEIIFEAGNKTVAWEMVQRLNGRISRLRAMTIASPNRERAGMTQMRKIFDAINKGDAEAAAKTCRDHVQNAADLALSLLKSQSQQNGTASIDTP